MAKRDYGLSALIGYTFLGVPSPVFFDPHLATYQNKPPVTFITGEPGAGKTFFGLLLAAYSNIFGSIDYIIDPKGDFDVLKILEQKGVLNKVSIWNVVSKENNTLKIDNENIGILDPTTLLPTPGQCADLTVTVIASLIGELTNKQKTTMIPIIQDITKNPSPSFIKVATKLMSSRDDDIRAIGNELNMIFSLPTSNLLINNYKIKKKTLNFNSGTTVISLLGLNFPDKNKNRKNYTSEEKISMIIMSLITRVVLELMKDKKLRAIPKTIICDEAWRIIDNESGASMINDISLLGRSLNVGTILLTQSPNHIKNNKNINLDTTISTRFAFRNSNQEDNDITCKAMGLPEGEGWETIIPSFENGECLMCNFEKQNGIVKITVPDTWAEIFDTNPANQKQKKG